MYHIRNGCEINIILDQSMHDWDVSIHEFSTDSLLKILNYCYGNTVNRCFGISYGCFYCTIIKHINTVLKIHNFLCKKSKSSLLQINMTASSVLLQNFIWKHDHRNDPRPYKNDTTAGLLKIYSKYICGSWIFCSDMVEKLFSYDKCEFCINWQNATKELIFQRQDHLSPSAFK